MPIHEYSRGGVGKRGGNGGLFQVVFRGVNGHLHRRGREVTLGRLLSVVLTHSSSPYATWGNEPAVSYGSGWNSKSKPTHGPHYRPWKKVFSTMYTLNLKFRTLNLAHKII